MPKLRKHSQLKQPILTSENQNSSEAKDKQHDSQSNASEQQPLIIGGKFKYKDRLRMIQKYQNQLLNHQQQHHLQPHTQKSNQIKQDQVALYLNSLPDDDLNLTTNDLAPNHIHNKIKIKKANKFFSSLQLENQSIQQKQQSEHHQIRIERKLTQGAAHLMQRTMQKALTFKNRLCFKDINKDNKFKNNIKDKLKSLDTYEEIDIVVGAPKILGGRKSHVEAALFLKNNRRDSAQNKISSNNLSESLQIKQQSSLPKDRKNYYEDLQKQIKLKRAQSITQSAMKICFKKSYLDETDFIHDLEQNNSRDPQTHNLNKQFHQDSKPIMTQHHINRQSTNQHKTQFQKQQYTNNSIKQELKQVNIANQQIQIKNTQNRQKLQQKSTKTLKSKQKKTKKKNKRKRGFHIQDYIQLQAQNSESQHQNKKQSHQQDETQEESEDTNISSFIGEEVTYTEQQEINAHKKFVSDMIIQEQKRYEQIRKKIQKQYLEQEKRQQALKQRMRQAKIANNNKQTYETYTQNPQPPQQSSQSQTNQQKNRNIQKLKQIGIQLGLQARQSNIPNTVQHADLHRLKQLQRCMLTIACGSLKLKRQGLRGINLNRNPVKDNIRKSSR